MPTLIKEYKSTSYLKIEVLNDIVEGTERVVHIRKICTGNPVEQFITCLLYTSPSPRDVEESRMASSA